jgi:hypothetical protein
MAIIEFMRNAGERLLRRATPIRTAPVASRQQQQGSHFPPIGQMGAPGGPRRPIGSTRDASHALLQYLRLQHGVETPDDLVVVYDADDGLVSLEGTAPDEEARELIVLLAGNIDGVQWVDDGMTAARAGARSTLHTVIPHETAASIARNHYGDERFAQRILIANAPLLAHARDVTAGLTIRLPA